MGLDGAEKIAEYVTIVNGVKVNVMSAIESMEGITE